MPKKKIRKPAAAGMKPVPKPKGFDPASLRQTKTASGFRLVPKRGLIPGKSGQR